MDKSIWEKVIRKDANKKSVGLYNRCEGRVCTEKREDISIVKRGKRRGKGVYLRAVEKGVYPTIKVTTDSTGILCREEEQKEKNGTRL